MHCFWKLLAHFIVGKASIFGPKFGLGRFLYESKFLCPRHDNGRGIKCYPCSSIRMYLRLSQRRPLSKSNTFDQNFMKLGHIVKYHDVLFKFDNGSYCAMLSAVMALCL